ncbi:MAG: GNAT family N-acetyltransferase [Chloroflexota bacterium]|nr:GNAT family N-acetyltransferase [Chloroflexota bacterium]
MHSARAASTADVDECAGVLADAFQADPGTMVFLARDGERAAILPVFFRTFVAAALSEGADIVVTGEPITGVASWFGPERHGPSPEAMGAHGLGAVLEQSGAEATGRLLGMLEEIEANHERLVTEPHLRLEFFGVISALQGKGIGTALIEHGHRRADELGLACYLETFSEPNVGYYERRGYRTVGQFTVGDNVRGYGMLRPAP